jgi:hypothetical protein
MAQSPRAAIRDLLGLRNKYQESNSQQTAKLKGVPDFPSIKRRTNL